MSTGDATSTVPVWQVGDVTVRVVVETVVVQPLENILADVALKERRRVVLMVREAPLHAGHLRSMLAVTEMGAIVAPPVPAFYARPNSLDEMVDHTIGRVLDLFDLDTGTVKRWQGG